MLIHTIFKKYHIHKSQNYLTYVNSFKKLLTIIIVHKKR